MAAASSLAFNRLPSPRLLSVLPRPPAAAVNPLSAVRFPRTTAARSDDYYRPSSPSCQNNFSFLGGRILSSSATMALRQFPSLIPSGSPRQMTQPAKPHLFISSSGPLPNLPAAARPFSSSSLRPTVTHPAAGHWRCFNSHCKIAGVGFFRFSDKFFVECGSRESQSFPPLYHECWVKEVRDGYHVRLYMCGVGKGNEELEILNPRMVIAQGTKPKDFEDEVDDAKTMFRYGILGPPDASFDHSAFQSEINDGVLKLFVPKK